MSILIVHDWLVGHIWMVRELERPTAILAQTSAKDPLLLYEAILLAVKSVSLLHLSGPIESWIYVNNMTTELGQ